MIVNIFGYTVICNALDLPPTYSSWLNLPPLDAFPERNPGCVHVMGVSEECVGGMAEASKIDPHWMDLGQHPPDL